jgi:hypothetical protein
MASDSGGRERRRWPRAPLGGEVVGRIYTEHAAPILDLSEGGALIEVPCALRPRSVYSVRLVIGPGIVLMLKASVVRSYVHHFENAGEGEMRVRYQAALQFVDLRAADQELLRRRIAGEALLFAAGLTDTGQTTDGEPPVERRDFMRVDLEGALAGEVGLHLESRVLMLSPGGMTVRMPFCPELGSIVTCALEGVGVPAQVRGIVRDTHQAAPESERLDFIVGLEFIDVQEEARMLIEAYLDRKA